MSPGFRAPRPTSFSRSAPHVVFALRAPRRFRAPRPTSFSRSAPHVVFALRASVADRNSPMVPSKRRPPGSLAWQQYEVNLISGRAVTLAFSLGDPRDETMARMKERHCPSHLGLLIVLDDPDSLEEVVLWFDQAQSLTLLSQNGEIM